MSVEFCLADGSVIVRVELLPHALDLGIGRCFGRAQLAVVIRVKRRERGGRSRALARAHAGRVGRRRSALVVRVGASVRRGLSRDLAVVPRCRSRAGSQCERGSEQSDKQPVSECVHRLSPSKAALIVSLDCETNGRP